MESPVLIPKGMDLSYFNTLEVWHYYLKWDQFS